MRTLQVCQHCHGKKTCTSSGGRSCKECLIAAGVGVRQWAAVRCSYCGGSGRVWVETEEQPEQVEQAVAPEAAPEAAAESKEEPAAESGEKPEAESAE